MTPSALLRHPELRQVVKYGIVGVANVAIDFGLYAAFVSVGVWYVAAKALSLAVATLNGYTVNRRWTFRAGRHCHRMLARYVAVQAGCLLANLVLLTTLVEGGHLGKVLAQAVVLPFVALMSFGVNRFWTFTGR